MLVKVNSFLGLMGRQSWVLFFPERPKPPFREVMRNLEIGHLGTQKSDIGNKKTDIDNYQ